MKINDKKLLRIRLSALIIVLVLLSVLASLAVSKETPMGTVTGTVKRFDSKMPLEGVTVHHPVRNTYVKTDGLGRYTLYGVPEGKHTIGVSANGFAYSSRPNVEIREGRTTGDIDFSLIRKKSYYHVYAYQKVFAPEEKPSINLRGYLVKKIDIKAYKIDPLTYLDRLMDSRAIMSIPLYGMKPCHEERFINNFNLDGDFSSTCTLPIEENGLYIIETKAVGGSLARSTWLMKTDLGLIMKRSPEELLVYAQNFSTGKPCRNATVRVFDKEERKGIGSTNSDGLFYSYQKSENPLRVIANDGNSFALASTYSGGYQQMQKTYIYTERPVYRPGQIVHFKGITRKKNNEKFLTLQGQQVQVKISDSNGTEIYNKYLYTNEYGTFNDSFKLDEEPPLGNYSIFTKVLNDESYGSFLVSEYKKPEYKIDVSTEKNQYIAGDRISIKIKGSYYFGAPVKGAPFNLTVYKSAYRWSNMTWSDYYGDESAGYGGIMFDKSGHLDENGEATITMPTGEIDYSLILGIEAEVTDISGRQVTGSTSVPLSVGEFALFGYTGSYLYSPSQEVLIHIEAQDFDENPVRNQPVEVTIMQIKYEEEKLKRTYTDADGNRQVYDEYAVKQVKTPVGVTRKEITDSAGKTQVNFLPSENGSYEAIITARDKRNNLVKYSAYFYVNDGTPGTVYSDADIKILTDKKKYNRNERASVIITSSKPDTYVLLTLEGRNIYEHRIVYIEKGATSLDFLIEDRFFPNFFISATAIKNMNMISDTQDIHIIRDEKRLNIAIKPDKKRYNPGETARYLIEVKDNDDKPVTAELSLGVVDEAIYAIAPDMTPDIHEFFWGYEYNSVDTNSSFARDYSGGLDKDRPGRIRKDFKDTAYWAPVVRTDKNGQAKVEFVMPDNLTTWITTVRCASRDTMVGSNTDAVLCTKDLLVRLETPRFMVQRDTVLIGGIVHNYTDKDQNIRVWLESQGVRQTGKGEYEEVIKPNEEKDFYWEVKAEEPGEAVFTLLCKGSDAEDAMELTMPVHIFGVEEIQAKSGKMNPTDISEEVTMELPGNVVEKASKLEISMFPSIAGTLMDNLGYLITYPYGCVEQTMSSFLPAVIAHRAFKKLGIKNPEIEEKIPKVVKKGLTRLYQLQHYDGGWGWWEDDSSQPYMTAYVVMGLKDAKNNGFQIPDYYINSGVQALQKMLEKPIEPIKTLGGSYQEGEEWNQRAYMLYALYKVGKPDRNKTKEAFANADKMNEYALALMAMTLDGLGEKDSTKAIMDELDKKAVREGGRCHWDGRTFHYSWVDNNIETTAYCMMAYLQIRPGDPKIGEIVSWLASKRVGNSYQSTKDTAAVVCAFTDYLLKTGELSADYNLKTSLNGTELANHRIRGHKIADDIANMTILYKNLKTGPNKVNFNKEGEGSLYYTLRLRYYDNKESIEEKAEGLKVTRAYFKTTRKKSKGGKYVEVRKPLEGKIQRGDNIRVLLTLVPDADYSYLIAEDPLPAGFEVAMSEEDKNTGSNWWIRREVRDEKVVFFIREVEKGKPLQLSYQIRSEMFGDVNALPTIAYCMYEPEIRGHSGNNKLNVKEEK